VPGVDPAILSLLTIEPRRSGLHANFVAPFRLRDGREGELVEAVESLATRAYPIPVGPLALVCADAFIVLRPRANHNGRTDPSTSERFHFQMQLAGPVPADARSNLAKHFAGAFEKLARDEVEIGTISLLRQDDDAARFRVLMCTRLTGR
jgi:hypothetical protein